MAGGCCNGVAARTKALDDKRWRRVLWIALIINAGMFLVEIGAGFAADSTSLRADALDFLGDAANYAISLSVAGMALAWRARAALVKGVSLLAFGLWVLMATASSAIDGTLPQAPVMGAVGGLALVANIAVAVLLYRFRTGDANMRSVWICSRNDAIGNLAVMVAALGVLGTGTGWPDIFIASIMAALGIWGGLQVIQQAGAELRQEEVASVANDRPGPA